MVQSPCVLGSPIRALVDRTANGASLRLRRYSVDRRHLSARIGNSRIRTKIRLRRLLRRTTCLGRYLPIPAASVGNRPAGNHRGRTARATSPMVGTCRRLCLSTNLYVAHSPRRQSPGRRRALTLHENRPKSTKKTPHEISQGVYINLGSAITYCKVAAEGLEPPTRGL
ncbi:hypothetical protein Pan97_30070 [Bremerella volcania]|uniref:Uncharacterized protein n=1 Tax=Bremerella volcania TaxID=2527984 RepID=A0A518C9Q4_9BACT|nr:hypothetical protein Pan97_30070 [Bremerella volcania]